MVSKWRLKIKDKVVLLTISLLLLFSLTTLSVSLYELVQSYEYHHNNFKKNLLIEKKEYLVDMVGMAYQVIAWCHESLPDGEAQKLATQMLSSVRYEKNYGYFLVYEKRGDDFYFVFHSVNKDWNNQKADINRLSRDGVSYRKELIDKAYAGGGFVQYQYLKPHTNLVTPKLSYAQLFTPWNWVIVGGSYLDDLEENLLAIDDDASNELHDLVVKLLALFSILILLAIVASYWGLGRHIQKLLRPLIDELEGLVLAIKKGDLSYRAKSEKVHVEFQEIVSGMNQVIDYSVAPILEAKEILQQLANADLTVRMVGNYQGDHQILKQSLNHSLDSIGYLLMHVQKLVSQVSIKAQQLTSNTDRFSQQTLEEGELLKSQATLIRKMQEIVNQNSQFLDKFRQIGEKLHTSANLDVQTDSDLQRLLTLWQETLLLQLEQIGTIVHYADQIEDIRQSYLIGLESYITAADQLNDQATLLSQTVEKFVMVKDEKDSGDGRER